MRRIAEAEIKKVQQSLSTYLLQQVASDGFVADGTMGEASPWNMIEVAIALCVVGEIAAAERVFSWFFQNQLADGSIYSIYTHSSQIKTTKEAHLACYIAVGMWVHYCCTKDLQYQKQNFVYLKRSMDFIQSLTDDSGRIVWRIDASGEKDNDCLLTAFCSVYLSVKAYSKLASLLEAHSEKASADKLLHLMKNNWQPNWFDITWSSKQNFAMDWYYPVLCGLVQGEQAKNRIKKRWSQFVDAKYACRCININDWFTSAESSELALVLLMLNEKKSAQKLLLSLQHFNEDGLLETGFTLPDFDVWPNDQSTYSAAAWIMATSATFTENKSMLQFLELAKE